MSNNPYNISTPVVGSQFFGRADILASVLRTFDTSAQNAVTIFGHLRFGKTSMLYELANRFPADKYLRVYWGLKDKADLSRDQVLPLLAKAIAQKAQLAQPHFPASSIADYFNTQFLPQVQQNIAPRRLVLLLDDIDSLIQDQDEANSLITYIQKLIVEKQPIAFVLSTSRRFQDLTLPFQRIGKQVLFQELQLLSVQERQDLIIESSRNASISCLPETVKAIEELAAGHPYLTQLICHEIFKDVSKKNKREVDLTSLELTLPNILDKSTPDLGQIITNLSQAQLNILSASALAFGETQIVSSKSVGAILDNNQISIEERELTQTFNELQKREVLRKVVGQDIFCFTVPLMASWVIKKHPLSLNFADSPSSLDKIRNSKRFNFKNLLRWR